MSISYDNTTRQHKTTGCLCYSDYADLENKPFKLSATYLTVGRLVGLCCRASLNEFMSSILAWKRVNDDIKGSMYSNKEEIKGCSI